MWCFKIFIDTLRYVSAVRLRAPYWIYNDISILIEFTIKLESSIVFLKSFVNDLILCRLRIQFVAEQYINIFRRWDNLRRRCDVTFGVSVKSKSPPPPAGPRAATARWTARGTCPGASGTCSFWSRIKNQ